MSFNPDKTEIMLFKNVENSTNFYCKIEITEDQEQTLGGPQQTHMRTMNLCLLLFGVYNIDNFQTILVNFLLFHNNTFCVSNLCAKLDRKPLRNHKNEAA
jgi:hypothetical protein